MRLLAATCGLLALGAIAAWWLVPGDKSEPVADLPQPTRSADDTFAAALAYLVQSGGDTVRLDDFRATDTHIQILANIERLRVVRIDGGTLTPAAGHWFASMPHLEQLHLRNIDVDDATLDAIAQSHSLWLLNLTSSRVSPEAVQRLADMPRLRQLRLAIGGGSNRYASAIAAIEGLRSVHLIGIDVSDEGLQQLASLPQLESLYLDDTAISDAGWIWLFDNHPQLHVHIDQKHHDRDPGRH